MARGANGQPRDEFVDSVVRRVHGPQPDGSPHVWELIADEPTERVVIWVDNNPTLESFLEEKINGPEIGA